MKNHTKPSANEPVLLILDNRASHISLPIYDYCKSNHIHMLSLPPHTSHKMQPLDVSFFGPLKAAYKKECDLFMKSHLTEKITPYDVASLVRKAFNSVASISKGESGFRATGIFPINPQVFSEEDFIASEILQSESIAVQDCDKSISVSSTDVVQDSRLIPSTSGQADPSVPGTSKQVDVSVLGTSNQVELTSPTPRAKESSDKVSTIQDLIKLPEKTPGFTTRQGRKKQHATVLTSTPIKENLIEKENKKIRKSQQDKGKEKEKWKGKGQGKKIKVQKEGLKRAKRQVLQESNDSTSVSDVNTNELCQDDKEDDAEDAETYVLYAANSEETTRFGTGVPHVGCGLTRTALGGILLKVMSAICVKFCLTLITHRVTTIAPISVQSESNVFFFNSSYFQS